MGERFDRVSEALSRGRGWLARTRPARRWGALSPRTRRSILQLGAAGLVLVVLAGLVLVPLAIPRSAGATASPIAVVSHLASATPSASPSPSPAATPTPEPQIPRVLASIQCGPENADASRPVVSQGRIYAICGNDIVVVDPATDKVVRTYESIYSDPKIPEEWLGPDNDLIPADTRELIVDDGLWIDDAYAGLTWRVDLSSGRMAETIRGHLVGDWGGYVWLIIPDQTQIQGFDPASGTPGPKLDVPPDVTYGCGSLWTWEYPSTLNRFGLDGSLLWSAKELDSIGYIVQLGSECWKISGTTNFLSRLGESCVIEHVRYLGGRITILGDTFWLDRAADWTSGYLYTGEYQRIDPSTWTTKGSVWMLPQNTDPFVAGSQFWIWNWEDDVLQRLDIPLEPWPYTPASPLPCPAATPAATHSASPSASPVPPSAAPSPS